MELRFGFTAGADMISSCTQIFFENKFLIIFYEIQTQMLYFVIIEISNIKLLS